MRPKELCSRAQKLLIAVLLTLVSTTSAWAANEKLLHSFVAFPHGANPQANLIADAAGNLYGTSANGGRYGYGTVFELAPAKSGKWNQTVLYSFTGGSDGGIPVAGLVFDGAGSLYGTTATGGVSGQQCSFSYNENGCGVVFKLSPSAHGAWAESVLYAFNGYPNDGQAPLASLLFDTAGNLYGTTVRGGAFLYGTVFELSPSAGGQWTETILYVFTGNTDGTFPYAGLTFDSSGNLYGTTTIGGDLNCNQSSRGPDGCGVVFQLTNNGKGTWTESVLHTFTSSDGAFPQGNLVFDTAGNLYGTTPSGPGVACGGGCGTVFRLKPNSDHSWTQSILYNFEGVADGAGPVAGVVLDRAGHLYGTTQSGGGSLSCVLGCGTVFELKPGPKSTWTEKVIHRFGSRDVVGSGSDGSLPMAGLLLDQQGDLYGTAASGGSLGGFCSDYGVYGGCGTVFRLAHAVRHKWATSLVYAFPPGSEGLGPSGGLISDSSGNLYGTTTGGGTNECSSFSGGGGGCGTVFQLKLLPGGDRKDVTLHNFNGLVDGAGPAASLLSDASGNLYGTTSYGGSSGCLSPFAVCGGTVFELSPTAHGWKETVLHRFRPDGSDGGVPVAGLIMDAAGSLYGTASADGIGGGTVFKLSRVGEDKWREEVLYFFLGGIDGQSPQSTLIFDDKGALYGTTCTGGVFGNGTVFKLALGSDGTWKESVLYSFQRPRSGDGYCPRAGVVADGSGNLFGTTFQGGNYTNNCANGGCGVVFELSPKGLEVWVETVLLAFQSTDGSNPKGGALTFDGAGNLYGAAPDSGTYNNSGGTVFELSPGSQGWTEQLLHHFGAGFDGVGPNGALIFDSAGNIYGTTGSGGLDGSGTVFELSPGSYGAWVENLPPSPAHPRGFTPPYLKPGATRESSFVRNIPQAR
jgi:uncharacterized repeat protein (TIGR03803 family)